MLSFLGKKMLDMGYRHGTILVHKAFPLLEMMYMTRIELIR